MRTMSQRIPCRPFKQIKQQQGWTMWSILFVVTVVLFSAYVAMQLVPIYSTNTSVKNAMMASLDGKNISKLSRKGIIADMTKRLYIDGNHELIDYKNELSIKKEKGLVVMQINYDREVPLFGNLVLIARFNPAVECDTNGRCN